MSKTEHQARFNLADIFEIAVDAFADREMLVVDGRRASFAELEARANRLAHHLASQGVGPGDHVGIYAYNSMEWVETMLAAIKLRALWVNINYRYVAKELSYLFALSDIKALVVQRQFVPMLSAARDSLSLLKHCLLVEDGSPATAENSAADAEYEASLAEHSPLRDFGPRSGDDRYILFTGGTTGMPKGVVWRHEDVFYALGGGVDAVTGEWLSTPGEIVQRAVDQPQISFMNCAPLMHGACQWGILNGAYNGRKSILISKFDPEGVWELMEKETVNGLMITGDAMGRPLIETLEANPGRWNTDSLFLLTSTAAVFSPVVKEKFLSYFPNLLLMDGIGASETGSTGMTQVSKEDFGSSRGGLTVRAGPDTAVLDEQLRPMEPGTGEIGKLARYGNIPLGYYRDEKKTAEVFVVGADERRYAIAGDFARLEEDGSITLLGRGSACINSGGMKIFPEEVEQVVKAHPDIFDAIVVGVPDERWGSRVAAVVQPRAGSKPSLESVQTHCREQLASFKLPREIHLVEQVVRSPSGKPDYPWAERLARQQ